MLKASLKRWVFNMFLKTLVSEMVRSSAGREFHEAGPENEKARSPNLVCSTHTHTHTHTQTVSLLYCQFARRFNAGRNLRRRRRSTGSRDLLRWAVGLQQQRRRRLFVPNAEVAA